MIENINISIYIVLIVIVYLFVILVSLYNSGSAFRNFVDSFISGLQKIKVLKNIQEFISGKILPVIRFSVSILIKVLSGVSEFTCRVDEFLSGSNKVIFAQPVNLTALVLRKLYGENEQIMLAAAAGIIVVFYFILTVF